MTTYEMSLTIQIGLTDEEIKAIVKANMGKSLTELQSRHYSTAKEKFRGLAEAIRYELFRAVEEYFTKEASKDDPNRNN